MYLQGTLKERAWNSTCTIRRKWAIYKT